MQTGKRGRSAARRTAGALAHGCRACHRTSPRAILGEEMEFLLIAIGAAVLFAAWNTDVKIDKISGKIDDLTKVAKAIQAEVETIRKIVR